MVTPIIPRIYVMNSQSFMFQRNVTLISIAIIVSVVLLKPLVAHAQPSERINGVSFISLDGWGEVPDEGFVWVLNNIGSPDVESKLRNTFETYQQAGINWVRILIAPDWFLPAIEYPIPPASRIQSVNDFMSIAADFGITTEIVFVSPRDINGFISSPPPYTDDKAWFRAWMNDLDMTHLGMVQINGDLLIWWPDSSSGRYLFYGDPAIPPGAVAQNHGAWVLDMWEWFHGQYPDVNASYEIITGLGNPNVGVLTADSTLLQQSSEWVDAYTPDVPYTSATFYFEHAPGVGWEKYAETVRNLITAYKSVTSRPLWIDEFGMRVCGLSSTVCMNTEDDQVSYYHGFLEATASMDIPRFAWTASNDYPFALAPIDYRFGLFSDYDASDNPVPRPAWNYLQFYYTLPTVAEIPVSIDIKPGNNRNRVNPRSKGILKVAILTTNDFDADTVDASTIQFGPSAAEPVWYRFDDVDYDGEWDLVLKFNTQETGIACGDTGVSLIGKTFDVQRITGTDYINTVGCKPKKHHKKHRDEDRRKH